MKYLIFLFLALTSLPLLGQNQPAFLEEDTFKFSTVDSVWRNDSILYKLVYYQDGSKKRQTTYHPNGNVSSILNFEASGQFHGKVEYWYTSGQKESESLYLHGSKDKEGYHWDSTGLLTIIDECNQGDCVTYYLYPNRNVRKQERHYQGRVYEVMYFCENGLQTQVFYPGNPLDPYYQYDCNGDRVMVGKLNANGTLVGKFEAYYSKDHLREKGEYKEHNGFDLIKIGIWLYFDEKGNLYLQENYDSNGNLLKAIKNPETK